MLNFFSFVYSCFTLYKAVIFTLLYQKSLTTITEKLSLFQDMLKSFW